MDRNRSCAPAAPGRPGFGNRALKRVEADPGAGVADAAGDVDAADRARFGGHPEAFVRGAADAKNTPTISPEFRRQMVDLVRAGRNPDDLAREFEPSGHSIRAWVAQADRNEGRREEVAPGLTAAERDELTRLRRENKQLRLERDILSKAAAWFARETGTLPSGSSGS